MRFFRILTLLSLTLLLIISNKVYSQRILGAVVAGMNLSQVDGDEIYDPAGLRRFRRVLESGCYDWARRIYGNVLNCIELDLSRKFARGYLSPPAHSMTKLYNFAVLKSWTGCSQRLHDGQIVYQDGYDVSKSLCYLHHSTSWEEADLRCLHLALMRRSSRQLFSLPRFSPSDEMRRTAVASRPMAAWAFRLRTTWDLLRKRSGKDQGYRRGPIVEKDITAFFPATSANGSLA